MNRIVRIISVILTASAIGLTTSTGRGTDQPAASGPALSAPTQNDRAWSPWSPPKDFSEAWPQEQRQDDNSAGTAALGRRHNSWPNRTTPTGERPVSPEPHKLPTSSASPLNVTADGQPRSEQLEFVAREADRKTRHGFELAGRGAFFAARAEFIGALRMIAEGLDTDRKTNSHGRSLSAALTAIREAEDFMPKGSRLEGEIDLPRLISTHVTPVLKTNVEHTTSLTAMRRYLTFAQEQFAASADREVAGSMALHALGKLYDALAAKQGVSEPTAASKAMVYYQAALLVYSENYMAANDLGVLLARTENLKAARGIFEYSLSLSRQSTTMRNLVSVYRQLGETSLAEQIEREADRIEQIERARRKYVQVADNAAVRWVDPQTFAQAAKDSPSTSPERVSSSTPAAGQRMSWGSKTNKK